MSIKINALSVENVKRVELVELVPSESGLTIIGGDNRQGKSSVLDAIAVALGGEKLAPTNAIREGQEKGSVGVQLSNGWTIQRTFTEAGTRLKVVDSQGMMGGQKLLDDIICKLALRIGDFLELDGKAKVKMVLQASGIDLAPIEQQIKFAFDERTAVNRDLKKLEAIVRSMPTYTSVDPVDVADLINKQADIIAQCKLQRDALAECNARIIERKNIIDEVNECEKSKEELRKQIVAIEAREKELLNEAYAINPEEIEVKSIVARGNIDSLLKQYNEISERIKSSQETNRKAAANAEEKKKRAELIDITEESEKLTKQIDELRESIMQMCAAMPLEGLAVADGSLTYKGMAWDCMSHSDQLIIATSIVQKLNPECGFVLIDKLESMDMLTLQAFGSWLEKNNLQAIATRVSKGDECSVIITDGKVDN